MTRANTKRHWTREPMVWMVIAIPLTSVVMGMVLIAIAVTHQDGLVADDYYKRGLEINEVIVREVRAEELALTADVAFEPSSNRISVSLSGSSSFEEPTEIQLGFYHATRRAQDRVLSLRRDAHGVYSAPMPSLSKGRWYVSAETREWRLSGVLVIPGEDGLKMTSEVPGGGAST